MRIKGRKLDQPNVEIIIIPRGNDQDIIFKAQAVLDHKQFEELCPAPKPPQKMLKGGKTVADLEDSTYQLSLNEYGKLRTNFMIIKSLEATEGLEWETVKMGQPDTWGNYETELRESKFSEVEIFKIVQGVIAANGLDEQRLEEARDRFLLSQDRESEKQLSQTAEQQSTPSGVHVKDSA